MSDAKYAMFIKAVDKKSLALAAQELCCTPSAVSHGISALETELGLKLMKRSRGGVELTAEGEHVIGAVRGPQWSGCSRPRRRRGRAWAE